jgi:hypothetical protein
MIAYSVRPKGMSLPYSVKIKQHDGCCEVKRTASQKVLPDLKLAEQGEDTFEKEISP